MSLVFKPKLTKAQERRRSTPNQSNRKSFLRNEIQIVVEEEKKEKENEKDVLIPIEVNEELDECDLEILAILTDNYSSDNVPIHYSDDSFVYYQYERSKHPALI